MKKNRAPQLPVGHRWHFDNSRSAHWSGRPRTVAFLAGLLVLLLAQAGGRAAVGGADALPFSKGFLVTGNYVVGGVDLTPQANPADKWLLHRDDPDHRRARRRCEPRRGISLLRGGPSDTFTSRRKSMIGIKFRGQAISPGAISAVSKPFSSGGATCWGSAGQGSFAVSMFRANVLSLHAQTVRLARQVDWKVHRQQRGASRERPAHGDVARKDR